jgi:hypothetical protein
MGTLEEREARFKDRLDRVNAQKGRQRVRVLPRDEIIRKTIAHPSGNLKFPKSGSVEWPNDSFTKKRIREGDVTIEHLEPEDTD